MLTQNDHKGPTSAPPTPLKARGPAVAKLNSKVGKKFEVKISYQMLVKGFSAGKQLASAEYNFSRSFYLRNMDVASLL